MSIVEIKNLTLGFSDKKILTNLSLTIDSPSFVAVIGHNGCGKSTFLKAIAGDFPYSGDITFSSLASQKCLIGFLEQKNSIAFNIPVKDLLVLGLCNSKGLFENFTNKDYQKALQILGDLGFEHLFNKNMLELSGGEQQMVWLAQVMLQNTPIVLLDEPTQHLDLYNKQLVFDCISVWVKEFKKTVFCVTHDLEYLSDMTGYLLNISSHDIKCEPINKECLSLHREILLKKY